MRTLLLLVVTFIAATLSLETPKVLLDDNFSSEFPSFPSKHTSVIAFMATWCGHCRNFKPIYERMPAEYDKLLTSSTETRYDETKEIKFYRVDIGAAPGVAARFMIRALPTIVVVTQNGSVHYYPPRSPRHLQDITRFALSPPVEEDKDALHNTIFWPFGVGGGMLGFMGYAGGKLEGLSRWIADTIGLWAFFGGSALIMIVLILISVVWLPRYSTGTELMEQQVNAAIANTALAAMAKQEKKNTNDNKTTKKRSKKQD